MSIRRKHLASLFVLAALGLTACGGAGGGDAGAEPAADMAPEAEMEAQSDEDLGIFDESADGVDAESGGSAQRANSVVDRPAGSTAALQEPAIIQVGTMTVQSDDVAGARFDLDKVVDAYRGSIADEKTTASTDGEVRLSRVVLRIPAADFDEAMIDIGKLGKVTASTRKAQDVTGQIIDTQARIRAQEQSLQRVEVLFTRAQDIRDIVAIESQLSRRQAELDSLKGQLAYLQDQADMSTLTVYLEPTPEPPKTAKTKQDDDVAFVDGLKDGWHALGTLGSGLATLAGALLPFAVVGLLVGVPGAVAARRWLARHPLRHPATEA